MKKLARIVIWTSLAALMGGAALADGEKRIRLPATIVPADARLEKIVDGQKFAEGPAWTDAEGGYLVFSDIPNNIIHRWSEKSGLGVMRHAPDQTNGNTFDRQGRLITCEHDGRRVVRLEKDGTLTTIADRFENKGLNNPNDVVVKSDGTIWFSDPTYGIKANQMEQTKKNVFRVDRDGKVTSVAADFDQPNGLCFSPDEKNLYVADSGKGHLIRRFAVDAKNRLSGGEIFAVIDQGVPDGIRCDSAGRVWSSAGDGVQVFSTEGKLVGKIPVPETPANLCFGGENGKTLFVAAKTSMYRMKLK